MQGERKTEAGAERKARIESALRQNVWHWKDQWMGGLVDAWMDGRVDGWVGG